MPDWVMVIASISQTPRDLVPGPEPWCLTPNPASHAPPAAWVLGPSLARSSDTSGNGLGSCPRPALCEESPILKENPGLPFLLPSQERSGCPGTPSGPGASLPPFSVAAPERPRWPLVTGNLPQSLWTVLLLRDEPLFSRGTGEKGRAGSTRFLWNFPGHKPGQRPGGYALPLQSWGN